MIKPLAAELRFADRAECMALGMSGEGALRTSFKLCERPRAVMIDGRPAAMFGINRPSYLSDVWHPWLLGSERLRLRSKRFMKGSRRIVQEWAADGRRMENFVHAYNEEAIKWLRLLGFKVKPARPHGPFKAAFCKFYWPR